MQQILSKFFLPLYLFVALLPGQVVEELGKMPELVAHYKVHQNINPSTSLLTFLSQHYGAGFTKHQSEHSHDNLPGKNGHTHASCACCFVMGLPEQCGSFLMEPSYVQEVSVQHLFCSTDLPPSQYLSGIWQPPKQV